MHQEYVDSVFAINVPIPNLFTEVHVFLITPRLLNIMPVKISDRNQRNKYTE